MVTHRAHVIAGWVFLNDFDIGSETGPGKHTFEQIVTEQRRLWHTALERGLENINIIDTLAGI